MKLFKISRTPYTWRFYLLPRVKIHWIRPTPDEWHTHPWNGFSLILGYYWEQKQRPCGSDLPWRKVWWFNRIGAHTPHRTRGNTLTLFIHGARVNEEWFWGEEQAPWRGVQKERGGPMSREEFRKELESLINKHSMENGSDTPDFILAEYLMGCLETYDRTVRVRERWYGKSGE